MEWLRRLVRKHTRPIPSHKARYYRDRFAFAYYMIAWTAGGIIFLKLLNTESSSLPDHLNVHASPNAPRFPDFYRSAEKIRMLSDDTTVTVTHIKNFSITSVETMDAKSLKGRKEETDKRAKEDFFGSVEEYNNEENNT